MVYYIYLSVFLMGAIIGSFLNVCICRIPERQSIAFPCSHCFSCGHPLKTPDLVPLFSWLFLRGRCRYCGSRISVQYPIIEFVSGLLAVLSFLSFGMGMNAFLAYLFSAGLLVIFVIDQRTMIIPDRMTLFLILTAVVWRIFNWRGVSGLWDMAFGLAIGSGFLFLLYIFGLFVLNTEVMGMGDIKLFIPIGLMLGGRGTVVTLYISAFSGALVAVCILLRVKDKKERRMPFGPYIASGAVLSLFFGDILTAYYWRLFEL